MVFVLFLDMLCFSGARRLPFALFLATWFFLHGVAANEASPSPSSVPDPISADGSAPAGPAEAPQVAVPLGVIGQFSADSCDLARLAAAELALSHVNAKNPELCPAVAAVNASVSLSLRVLDNMGLPEGTYNAGMKLMGKMFGEEQVQVVSRRCSVWQFVTVTDITLQFGLGHFWILDIGKVSWARDLWHPMCLLCLWK